VVTTAGSGAVIGDVLFDNGLNDSNPMAILAKNDGREIAVMNALSGGTISLDVNSIYIWDDDGLAWVKIGDVGNTTGPVRMIRYAIATAASVDSIAQIPANAIITRTNITTPYSGGATIDNGDTGTADKFQPQGDIDPQTVGIYVTPQSTDQGGSASVGRTAIGGAPGAGAGFVEIFYSNPNV
jgi:hypothetical protein